MATIFRDNKSSRSWSEIAYDFFDIVTARMNDVVRRQQLKVFKIAGAFVILFVGTIFFLIGTALFIGKLINDQSWSGYLVVGIILIVIGALVSKNKF